MTFRAKTPLSLLVALLTTAGTACLLAQSAQTETRPVLFNVDSGNVYRGSFSPDGREFYRSPSLTFVT